MSISHGQKLVNHYSGFCLFETCFGLITALEKLGSSGWADHGAVKNGSGDWSGEMLMTGETMGRWDSCGSLEGWLCWVREKFKSADPAWKTGTDRQLGQQGYESMEQG